ncbi:UNVERIFIED_CONTAM: hypothetical protein GTU68_063777, partial [Idotea baltica]|nr:hypothetical protein [Idotea baltica]
FLQRQGDNTLILGHRVSEWCGIAPVLEEDIALANTALDLIGQTQLWLAYAGEVEGKGRDANDLAFLRDAYDFKNLLMLETPNRDFGYTMLRQFLFDAFQVPFLRELENSSDQKVAEIAHKSGKEAKYHLERSRDTVIALGDGTEESNNRMQDALNFLWPYTGEMFDTDDIDLQMVKDGIAPNPSSLRKEWDETISNTFSQAFLKSPDTDFYHKGGKNGRRHTEHLGHLLAVMQTLQRSHPGATW